MIGKTPIPITRWTRIKWFFRKFCFWQKKIDLDKVCTPVEVGTIREDLMAQIQMSDEPMARRFYLVKRYNPLHTSIGFNELARKLMPMQELPEGAYARYNKDKCPVCPKHCDIEDLKVIVGNKKECKGYTAIASMQAEQDLEFFNKEKKNED